MWQPGLCVLFENMVNPDTGLLSISNKVLGLLILSGFLTSDVTFSGTAEKSARNRQVFLLTLVITASAQ